jgi:ABC-type polysaccharide/polyol phosphate transport system ATPase subunit
MKKEETKKQKQDEVAIRVENLSKTFKVPHEKNTSIKGAALNMFRKKNYERFEALKDISFEVKRGEFFGIIGRNGSGKSTLLKILAGIYVPDSGTVTINGKLSPFLELGVGFNPELTGRENLFLGGAILGLARKEIEEKFDKIVHFAELEEFIDMKLKNYSSGMHVRLAFSLAINAHAEILLMDEVLAVGDSNFQAKCLEEFNSYRDQGKTVILVTHDIGTVQRYCNRAMLLRNGKIVKIGTAEEVGNEYIYQNMSDEERRQSEGGLPANGVQAETVIEENNKAAKILGVEFLDKDGKKKNVFELGEDVTVRAYFSKSRELGTLNFGLALHNQEGNHIFGTNTILDHISNKDAIKKGYFQVTFKNINLLTNSYYFYCAVAKDNFALPVDILPKTKYFRVKTTMKNEGIVNLDYEWN